MEECNRVPLPRPSRFLVFMKMAVIPAQIRLFAGLTGKFVSTKDLGADFGSSMGVIAGRREVSRQRTGPVTGQGSQSCGDASNVRLSISVDNSPSSCHGQGRTGRGQRIGRGSRM